MTTLSKNMSQLVDKYKFWLCRNPEKVKFIENYCALALSFITGKVTESNIPYDWIAFGTRLLRFFNNHILNAPDPEDIPDSDKIKIFTTIVEYAEISLERTAQYIYGESGRWKLIVFLQCFKLLVKLTVHLYYKERIVCCPYNYLPVDIPQSQAYGMPGAANGNPHDLSTHFVLKRSGRVIRMVHSAPPLYNRLWIPPAGDIANSANARLLEKMLLIGELLYIFKPIVTMGAMKKYGLGTWKPWTISLIMDLVSLYLINYPNVKPNSLVTFSPSEREEMGTRLNGLFLYLMRSPFYERHTKDRLKTLLSVIPVLGSITEAWSRWYISVSLSATLFTGTLNFIFQSSG